MAAVELTRHGRIGVVTVDNPPVNALSQPVRSGLAAAIDNIEADAAIDAAVLRCAGRTFIAGADIREFDKPPEPPPLPEVVARIEASTKPVVAALHGTALGGGLEVALGCHYRVALESARVGLPEVNLGLLPGASGTQRLPRLTGIPKALDMILSGKPIDAREALAAGILDELVDGDDPLEGAIDFANRLLERGAGPRRIRDLAVEPVEPGFFSDYRASIARKTRGLVAPEKILRCVEKSLDTPFDEAVAFEREQFLECKASEQSSALRHVFFAEREVSKVPGLTKDTVARDVSRIAVIGAGTMGAGIAYNCLTSGFEVTVLDNRADGLAAGLKTIAGLYDSGIERGKATEADKQSGLARLNSGRDLGTAADADLVIEAVFESLEIKREVFGRLDEICRDGAVLATNTSTLDIDRIAAATKRPIDVIGMHFFSPAHVMRLLEIVRGADTAPDVIATALAVAKRLGKLGVVVGNCFGFVGNRMLYGYGREAQLLLLEGAAPQDIDKALTDFGMAMGPHAVGDLAGLDVGYKVRREREDLPDDPRFYRIADLLVERGRLGQKTGKGMYRYEKGSRTPIPDPEVDALIANEAEALGVERREIGADEIVERCIYALVVEGARILEDGISPRPSDIDVVWINGYGFPRHRGGPMYYADAVGVATVYEAVCAFRERFGPLYWEPPRLLEELARSGGRFGDG